MDAHESDDADRKESTDGELTDDHADPVEEAVLAVFNHLRSASHPFATVATVREDLPEHVPDDAVEPALERLERDGVLASYAPGRDRLWYADSHLGGDDLEHVREMNDAERELQKEATSPRS